VSQDLYHFSKALSDIRKHNKYPQVLSRRALNEMWRAQGSGDEVFGLGWQIDERAGQRMVSHAGRMPGYFRPYTAHYLDDDVTVIVLSNVYDNPSRQMANDLADIARGKMVDMAFDPAARREKLGWTDLFGNVALKLLYGTSADEKGTDMTVIGSDKNLGQLAVEIGQPVVKGTLLGNIDFAKEPWSIEGSEMAPGLLESLGQVLQAMHKYRSEPIPFDGNTKRWSAEMRSFTPWDAHRSLRRSFATASCVGSRSAIRGMVGRGTSATGRPSTGLPSRRSGSRPIIDLPLLDSSSSWDFSGPPTTEVACTRNISRTCTSDGSWGGG